MMFSLIVKLSNKYPKAEILGHRDFPGVAKACPSFDVKSWLKDYDSDLNLKKAA
jgi:N-acetylmuramoyl-L-alanine amidase